MTRFARGGGRSQLSSAGQRYVQAKGGSSRAAASATSGRAVTAGVGSFLSSVASQGLKASLDALGLADVVGKSAMSVLAAITDRIAPAGNTVEEAAARRAANDVIEKLYQLCDEAGGDLGALEQMTEDDVRQAIHESAASYVYHRWAEELGLRIEQGAVSAASAVALERQMRDYIRERVTNLLGDRDPLSIDWAGKEGSAITMTVYEEAYRLLEVGE